MPEVGDLLGALGRVAGIFTQAPGSAHLRIWEEVRPWLGRLVVHAGPKWLPRLAIGVPCQVPVYVRGAPRGACNGAAIAACDVCQRTCCLDHARIDQLGDAICYLCVAEAVAARQRAGTGPTRPNPWAAGEQRAREQQPGPPPSEEPIENVTWARGVLDVDKNTPWEEVRAAHRRLSAKHHPDRHKEKNKARETEKFKQVQRAFDLLQKDHEAQEAAA